MSTLALSTLTSTGDDPVPAATNALSRLAGRLGDYKLAGVPFEAAWNAAVREVRGLHAYTKVAEPEDVDTPSPLQFARVRFEAAYRGEDYSRPTCKTRGCPELAYRHGQCRLHCPIDHPETP
jgi:hypothetical protein